jgi:O-methyltransferase
MPPRIAELAVNVGKNIFAPYFGAEKTRRGTLGQDGNPELLLTVLDEMAAAFAELNFSIRDKKILELGCGRSSLLATTLWLSGAESVVGIDPTNVPPEAANETVTATALSTLKSPAGLRFLESVGSSLPYAVARSASGPASVSFQKYDGDRIPFDDARFSLSVSVSVLEHVPNKSVGQVLRELHRVSTSDAIALHGIDLRDHTQMNGYEVHGDWLKMLRLTDLEYSISFSRRSTFVNRLRSSDWVREFSEAGFLVEVTDPILYPFDRSFDESKIQKQWQRGEHELQIGRVTIGCRLRDARSPNAPTPSGGSLRSSAGSAGDHLPDGTTVSDMKSVLTNVKHKARLGAIVSASRLARKAGVSVRRDKQHYSSEELSLFKAVNDFTMTSRERIVALRDAVLFVHTHSIPGAIVECGVWRGGSMMAVALTLTAMGDTSRELYLYDTFGGMTKPSVDDVDVFGQSADQYLSDAAANHLEVNLDQVQRNMSTTGYPAAKTHYVVGPVEETIPLQIPSEIAILRLDTDWYESTKHELEHLLPLVAHGGLLILDDYGHWQGARRAVDEYLANTKKAIHLARIDSTGRIAQIYR